jgi:hypothetical protein
MNAATIKPAGSPHSVALFIALLALAIQTLVVQTHIHAPREYTYQPAPTYTHADTSQHEYLGDEWPANCPLCQEMLLGGHFLMASAIQLPTPAAIDSDAAISRELISRSIFSHSWHGRAPPSV